MDLYKIHIKYKKFILGVIFYFVDLTVVTCQMEYKEYCQFERMNFAQFRLFLVELLIQVGPNAFIANLPGRQKKRNINTTL